jgi:hypothetical protein
MSGVGFHNQHGIPYSKATHVGKRNAPDRLGDHNLSRTNVAGGKVKHAPARLGKLDRHDHHKPGIIVDVHGWRHGYWHHNRGWRDSFWFWDYYFFNPVVSECVPSLYYFYGCLPGYLWCPRVIFVDRPVVVYVEEPVVWHDVDNGYYLERPAANPLDSAVSDIVAAWRDGNPDLLDKHVDADTKVAVFLDGEYSYSLEGADFAGITRDAVQTVQTKSFTVDRVAKRNDDMVVVYAKHTYVNTDDYYETVYVAYTLERLGDRWIITEAGSSHKPLDN